MSSPIINTFNTQLINLAEALSDRFKDDGDLKLALTGIKTLKAKSLSLLVFCENPEKSMEECQPVRLLEQKLIKTY